MSAVLNRAVLAGGRIFPAGTVREGDAADLIPDGDWWTGEARSNKVTAEVADFMKSMDRAAGEPRPRRQRKTRND